MNSEADPRMPASEMCVQRYMLERWAELQPEKIFAVFADGTNWTYAQTLQHAITTANALRALGVKRGEQVLCWLPNDSDCVRLWFGLNYLGAVYVPINLAYRGSLLRHAVALSDARLAVVHADLHQRLAEVELGELKEIVVMGGVGKDVPGLTIHQADRLTSTDTRPLLDPPLKPWDLQSIIFTSGTTGPSKGVLSSYMHLYRWQPYGPR